MNRVKPGSPVEKICARFADSLARGTFARLALSAPVAGGADTPQKILGRFVMLKGEPHLSLTLRHATRDVIKNLPVAAAADWLRGQLGVVFRSALVCTTQRDWQYISNDAGEARLIDHQPASKQAPSREHDRKRTDLLAASARDWLHGLGVLDKDGRVRASMADKHRQINHYLEIVSHLARDCGWVKAADTNPATAATSKSTSGPTLQFADMGCGKGYLTFGLWHLLHRVWKQPARVIGVEARADLVATTNQLARRIGAEGLEFVAGSIASAQLPRVDALIALHACDTATDDAIRRGIEGGAKLIVVAPCCHQAVRPGMGMPEPLAAVLRHGLMTERMAEWATDGLRTLFLEWAGYRTKVLEFVGVGHTPKNLMIAAIREREPFADATAAKRIQDFKAFFGLQTHALDALLSPRA